ncbi:MAG TPA: phosphoenolpyruvate--protein phosphotransferase [Polyangiales bacterium]|nr:phosphoenolpyruvate--protein phosphotransferase [Polyangiales bacterium]
MGGTRQVLSGIAASPGVAVGRVCFFDSGQLYVPRRYVQRDGVEAEIARLHAAIEESRQELDTIRQRIGAVPEHRLLLDAQLLMHRDELLIHGAVELLLERSINAEWALAQVTERIAERMRGASEAYFRERAGDVKNVGERILRKLVGGPALLPQMAPDSVIVADDLGPADAALLLRGTACGIAIDLGSASSHTAILARALEIPAVVGARQLSRMVADDDLIIVDAFRGEVVLWPSEDELESARARGTRYRAFTRSLRERVARTLETADGTPLKLSANVELPAEAAVALQEGATGIGLYRTEFLYLDRVTPPNEEEQFKVYRDVAQVLAPRPVVFRTFDIGGDKLHGFAHSTADVVNPALGLRALRFGLERPELLTTQLRAMLRASDSGDVRIMFPLVSGVDELRRGRALVEAARTALLAEGHTLGRVLVGCMIEVPSAVLMAEELARECDFFSVGTNDLVQYALAVDRANPAVATLASPLHPAVLRLLDLTARAARGAGIELAICGGMAADPLALPVLLGLGYDQLSVDVGYLPLARAIIERIEMPLAREAAEKALACTTTAEVKALLGERFRGPLGDLWAEQGFEP